MEIYYHSFSEIQLLFYKKLQIRLVFLDKVRIFTDKMKIKYFNGIFFAYKLTLSLYFTVCQPIFSPKNSVLLLLFLNYCFILAKILGVLCCSALDFSHLHHFGCLYHKNFACTPSLSLLRYALFFSSKVIL